MTEFEVALLQRFDNLIALLVQGRQQDLVSARLAAAMLKKAAIKELGQAEVDQLSAEGA